jgi:peptidoglycan/LPS O-acetylase OafA/YrhL
VALQVDTTRPAHAGRLGYRPGLDGLRAFGILTVMALHAGYYSSRWFAGGLLGVQIFFVISGFLITALLVEEFQRNGRIRLGYFYLRRALRLFPALWLMLAVVAVVTALGLAPDSPFGVTTREAFAAFFYWENWYRAFELGPRNMLTHTWSLSVEEPFYLLWPLLLIAGIRWAPRALLPLTIAAAVTSSVARASLWHVLPGKRLYYGTDLRADGLLFGCALALIWAKHTLQRVARILPLLTLPSLIVLAVLLHTMNVNARMTYQLGFLACDLAMVVLIGNVVLGAPGHLLRVLELRFIVWIGKVSYGLYLWHVPVFWLVTDHVGGLRFLFLLPLEVGLTFAVATASSYLVELPVVRKKSRFTPRRDGDGSQRRTAATPLPGQPSVPSPV